MAKVSEKDLKAEMDDIQLRYRSLKVDELFDPSSFYKHADHHINFEKYWELPLNKHRDAFSKAMTAFKKALEVLENE